MHPLAAASSSSALGVWAYLAVFAAAAFGYMGIPFIGAAAIGFAAVLASQGRLNIAAVLLCRRGCALNFGTACKNYGKHRLTNGPFLAQRSVVSVLDGLLRVR
jgi:membrane protein DedA with SNARE-associated domain